MLFATGRTRCVESQDQRAQVFRCQLAVRCCCFECSALSRVAGKSELCSVGESESYNCAVTDFALNPGGAAVKIDNRFYQSQAQARSIRSAR